MFANVKSRLVSSTSISSSRQELYSTPHQALVIRIIVSAVVATDKLYAKIEQRLNRIARANNVSDDTIIVRELHTFVNDNGLRRQDGVEKPAARRDKPAVRREDPQERELNLKIIDLMRQAIYASQDRIKDLDPIHETYRNDQALRMRFIFDKLEQMLLDIKRVYTLAVRWRTKKRVFEQLVWYAHCARKYTDILYTVELALDTHGKVGASHFDELPPGHAELPPGHAELPPGHGELPPGHGELPPGHAGPQRAGSGPRRAMASWRRAAAHT